MLKLLPWRRWSLDFRISAIPSPFLTTISRFLTHSQSLGEQQGYISDPPFSSTTTKTLKPLKTKKKKSTKTSPSNNSQNSPVSSDLPFDFRYSYSETNSAIEPIGFREPPKFSPFGPGRLDRKWTGTCAPAQRPPDLEKVAEERQSVLGESLSEEEIAELVDKYRYNNCSRQINLGKGGVTHNMLEDIHNHWKRAEAVRIKCYGVPTLDMDNVCFHLEDKSGGKIVYRHINVLLLFRGRNYDLKNRPTIPLMLWKPYAPIFPKLVKNVADGLTFEETKEMRTRGLNSPPLTKLTRNGVYINVVEKVRVAFQTAELVRLDCSHVGTSDCKKISVKLRDLVPCIPILVKDEQIILWRGKRDEDQNCGSSTELAKCKHT
ncbi:PREDICTED: CRS2-associated factor 2, mitochondrial [Ipomoea nil]|uniref:CRS2-associated factor 2, mitochondrial n=1 Tax=Ipomoea nil TaxID=35883 RepID=UPI000901C61F|nr:PREDICTED: CRS2-associated factor 2, mitochondrial [Ipomoea nil]